MEELLSRLLRKVEEESRQAAPLVRVLCCVARAAKQQQDGVGTQHTGPASASPLSAKERGNALYKREQHQAALAEYGTGLGGLRNAALALSNRSACAAELPAAGTLQEVGNH